MFDKEIGFKHLTCIHLNDAKEKYRDRHESLFNGFIGNKYGTYTNKSGKKVKFNGDPYIFCDIVDMIESYEIPMVIERNDDKDDYQCIKDQIDALNNLRKGRKYGIYY